MLFAAASVTDWLTAIGTVGAVVVAVSLQWWISWSEKRRAPVLTLVKDELWKVMTDGWPSLRLAVRNEPGRHAAHDVQVSVDRVTEANGAVIHNLANTSLRWSSPVTTAVVTIPPGAARYVDVGAFVSDGMHGMQIGAASLLLVMLRLPLLAGAPITVPQGHLRRLFVVFDDAAVCRSCG
jgi:hypothetical protein